MKVLITGGAGFIGSTIASACLDSGITPVVLDDLSTGRREFLHGRTFYEADVADAQALDKVFSEHDDIEAVVHCAARIVVPESVAAPVAYYRNNVAGLLSLLDAMARHRCERLLFSSSASIYATSADFSVDESSPLTASSPYARTKVISEQIIEDTCRATSLRAVSLRYFNPVGADPQLRTGLQLENPTHALGLLFLHWQAGEPFRITGTNWPTRDGTGIRDYVHVWDLAAAHVLALRSMDDIVDHSQPVLAINLGTGVGTTVRELVEAFCRVVGHVERIETPPRVGDVAGAWARAGLAVDLLGWKAARTLDQGIADSLAWLRVRNNVLGLEAEPRSTARPGWTPKLPAEFGGSSQMRV